jgi:hypothetical protein
MYTSFHDAIAYLEYPGGCRMCRYTCVVYTSHWATTGYQHLQDPNGSKFNKIDPTNLSFKEFLGEKNTKEKRTM